jgi:hypothetical protein
MTNEGSGAEVAEEREMAEDLQAMLQEGVLRESRSEESEPRSEAEVGHDSSEVENVAQAKTYSMDEVAMARSWFSSLPGDARLVALGFQDADFLETLFRVLQLTTHGHENLVTDRQG